MNLGLLSDNPNLGHVSVWLVAWFYEIRSSINSLLTRDVRVYMSVNDVYLVWHTDAHDDEKLIGVYRTQEDALAAIERTKKKPGFSDEGGKFESCKYELNQDHWTEGFGRPVD